MLSWHLKFKHEQKQKAEKYEKYYRVSVITIDIHYKGYNLI